MTQSPTQRFAPVCCQLVTLVITLTTLISSSAAPKAAEPHLCDQLTASALDIERVADAVSFENIDGALAVNACEAAVDAFPKVTRFQYQLGRALARTDKDVEAQVWHLKAARGAHAAGQYSHGLGYALGRGVPQSSRNAVWWWRKAAEQQLANAQFNLANMYEQGEGVKRDTAEAYLWYSLAARQETLRLELQERFAHERDRLAATLDPSLRESVELRLATWTPGFVAEHYRQLVNTKDCARCVLKRGDFRHLSLSRVNLHGAELEWGNFRGVYMRGANLNGANLEHAHFSGANLRGANLANANLYYANLYGTTYLYGANLDYADMRKVRLMNADLTKASLRHTDLRESHFGNCIFIGANLTGANLELAIMRSADLRGADLSNANLSNADFSNANLEGANLSGAKLNGTSFKEANLLKANLTGATIANADFTNAKILNIIGVDPRTLQ